MNQEETNRLSDCFSYTDKNVADESSQPPRTIRPENEKIAPVRLKPLKHVFWLLGEIIFLLVFYIGFDLWLHMPIRWDFDIGFALFLPTVFALSDRREFYA